METKVRSSIQETDMLNFAHCNGFPRPKGYTIINNAYMRNTENNEDDEYKLELMIAASLEKNNTYMKNILFWVKFWSIAACIIIPFYLLVSFISHFS